VTAARAMRVAFLTSSRLWRGSGVSLAKIAAGLGERGHQPHMLAGSPVVRDAFAELGLPATVVRTRKTGLREARELRRQLRALGTEALLVDKPRDLRLASVATLGFRTALLYRYNHSVLGGPLGIRTRLLLRRAAGCIFQSERVRQQALQRTPWLGRARAWVIPNGYDLSRFARSSAAGTEFRLRNGVAPDAAVVVTVSALEKGKGQDVAIEAMARVGRGSQGVYVVCGEGDQEPRLRMLAAQAALPTLFMGYLGVADVVAAFSAADVVVHPSLHDIFPNAVGEAMACGCAVIASEVGGVGELVGRDGTAGILVPPGDPGALAHAIGILLADPARREALGAAARRRIESDFPLTRMLDAYETVLRASIVCTRPALT